MNQHRHPAGTSVGGQYAPGAASEVTEPEVTAENFEEVVEPVTMRMDFWDDSDGEENSTIRSQEIDIRHWLHTRPLREIELMAESLDDKSDPSHLSTGSLARDELTYAGRAEPIDGQVYCYEVDSGELDEYIRKREWANLEEPLRRRVPPTPQKHDALFAAEFSQAADLRGFEQTAFDHDQPAERRIERMRQHISASRQKFIDETRRKGLSDGGGTPAADLQSILDYDYRSESANDHDQVLRMTADYSALNRQHGVV